jgi:hypothetical protein
MQQRHASVAGNGATEAPWRVAEVLQQEVDHCGDLRRAVAAGQVHRVNRHGLHVMRTRQQRHQLLATQRITDEDVAKANHPEAEDRELHGGLCVVGRHVAVDLDAARTVGRVERPVRWV